MKKYLYGFLRVLAWPFIFWRVTVAILLSLIAVHIIVDQLLLRRLAAQTETIRAAGRPVTFSDLDLPEYTVLDNADVYYQQAGKILEECADGQETIVRFLIPENPCVPNENGEPLPHEHWDGVRIQLEKAEAALEAVRKAQTCGVCIFHDVSELFNQTGKRLATPARMRDITRYCVAKALWESRHGNGDAAFEWFTIALHVANDMEHYPALLGMLVRIACVELVTDGVQTALNETLLPATLPDAWFQEMAKSLDRKSYAHAYDTERLFRTELITRQGLNAWRITRPFFTLNSIRIDGDLFKYATAFENGDFKKEREIYNSLSQSAAAHSRMYLIAQLVMSAALQTVRTLNDSFAQTGLCNVALALENFKMETGAYPDSPAEAKFHLPNGMPTDVYSGKPFLYQHEADGFILYSVGANGRDDGGKTPDRLNSLPNDDIVWCVKR